MCSSLYHVVSINLAPLKRPEFEWAKQLFIINKHSKVTNSSKHGPRILKFPPYSLLSVSGYSDEFLTEKRAKSLNHIQTSLKMISKNQHKLAESTSPRLVARVRSPVPRFYVLEPFQGPGHWSSFYVSRQNSIEQTWVINTLLKLDLEEINYKNGFPSTKIRQLQ